MHHSPISPGSTAATAAPIRPDPREDYYDYDNASSTSLLSSPPPPPPPPPALAFSPPDDPPRPSRVKAKSSLRSLRSLGSSHGDDRNTSPSPSPSRSRSRSPSPNPNQPASEKSLIPPSILRRLSPGLAARVKLLDGSHKNSARSRNPGAVGRIPQEHIKELDNLHKDLSVRVVRKGKAWNASLGEHPPNEQDLDPDIWEVVEPGAPDAPSVHREQQPTPAETPSETPSETPERTLEPPLEFRPPESTSPDEEIRQTPPAMSVIEEPALAPPGPASADDSNAPEQTDFEKYVQTTRENDGHQPPPPPPKDDQPSRPASSASSSFNPARASRTDSIYSFGRSSFSNQISQLTSVSLPQPSSLESTIAGIATAPSAVKALTSAAEQIKIWIGKASDVLGGLDAEDDVEWAAAGGREGLESVDKAITRFESLVNVYVKAIEEVQLRDDINEVGPESLNIIVVQMDSVIQNWAQIKRRLRAVKEQVELAMEWEELWNSVLGDVGAEVDDLGRLVFEMEEKRHMTMSTAPESHSGVDINELETIVEETPSASSKRLSMEPILAAPPTLATPIIQTPHDDTNHSNLIALFARIQPLRASLDFLPMRMSMFQSRAESIFPSACEELEERRSRLEKSYRALEADAESLRRELSEDRWILVFRGAGGQAQKMFESVERSIGKLQEGLETGGHLHNPADLVKKIESYEAKRQHYVPAIERVLTIIEKGVQDRRTVNGETIRLLSDMTSRIDALKASMRVMDASLEDVSLSRSQHMRDSISTIVTTDSPTTGSGIDSPGSSPASSVVMTPAMKGSTTPLGGSSRRGSSVSSAARSTMNKVRRFSGIPQATATLTGKKSAIPKPSFTASPSKPSFSATSPSKHSYRATTPTPFARRAPPPIPAALANRPRWSSSVNTNDLDVGHSRLQAPSPLPSRNNRLSRPASTLPFSHSRDLSVSPAPPRTRSRISSRLGSHSPAPGASPTPSRSLLDPPPYSKLRRPLGPEAMVNTPRNRQSYAGLSFGRSVSHAPDNGLLSPTKAARPETALGHSGSRRISLLPMPKGRSGRDSATGNRSKVDDRPRWR
ncbi:KAR9 family protein [Aspergillus candidus]|uniref:KAR9-domain-containing protein n=1 Tax=Aspergillus candidus TaxID=41067 RepID=A0A2I2FL11_ASPCN|nr:KAR9-domain-containing protein [Aspergillus candidus]PLB41302.1 KAR9-domain-containing protein [Aspergillus candidus]